MIRKSIFIVATMLGLGGTSLYGLAQQKQGSGIRAGWIDSAWVRPDGALEMRYYPAPDLQEYINASLIDKQVPDVITGKSTKRMVIVPYLPENRAEDMLRVIEADSCRVFGIVRDTAYKAVLLMMIDPVKGVRHHQMWHQEVRWEE